MIKLLNPNNGEVFSITSDIYKEFRKRDLAGEHRNVKDPYRDLGEYFDGESYGSAPVTVRLSWKNTDDNAKNEFSLRLASGKKHPAAVATVSEVTKDTDGMYFVCVTNLMSGEEYIWSVDGSEERSFSTEKGEMRFINAEGYANVRDMGGRINMAGQQVNQGLIYRGVCFEDYDKAGKVNCEDGKRVFREDLAIKCEIDLRRESAGYLTESPLGDGTRFCHIPFEAYGATLNDGGRGVLRQILELMADEANLPLYYHCYVGADRTGTIGAYLDAILGMSDEEIIFNYNVTTLSYDEVRCWGEGDCADFVDFLEETYPGHTLGELLMINLRLSGISEETIEKIRSIMLK